MGKGYAEGPAVEEAQANLERANEGPPKRFRKAVFGSTAADGERHFIGWADDVDPLALFESGEAWGVSVSEIGADEA